MTIVNVKCSNLSLLIFLMLVKKNPLLSFYDYRYYIINNIRFYCFFICRKKLNVLFVGKVSRLIKRNNCMYIFSLPDEQYVGIHVLFDNNCTKYNDYVNISNNHVYQTCMQTGLVFSWFKCTLYGSRFVKLIFFLWFKYMYDKYCYKLILCQLYHRKLCQLTICQKNSWIVSQKCVSWQLF